jgi:uncharacterized protein (TIGR02647 family)
MPFTPDLIDEVNILAKYNLETTLEGIKVHKTAEESVIQATSRLYNKGLVTQQDGGYLTDLGREVAEHVQAALTILTSS